MTTQFPVGVESVGLKPSSALQNFSPSASGGTFSYANNNRTQHRRMEPRRLRVRRVKHLFLRFKSRGQSARARDVREMRAPLFPAHARASPRSTQSCRCSGLVTSGRPLFEGGGRSALWPSWILACGATTAHRAAFTSLSSSRGILFRLNGRSCLSAPREARCKWQNVRMQWAGHVTDA